MKRRGPTRALHGEVRESLGLIAMTAATMVLYLGLGLFAVRVLG